MLECLTEWFLRERNIVLSKALYSVINFLVRSLEWMEWPRGLESRENGNKSSGLLSSDGQAVKCLSCMDRDSRKQPGFSADGC